MAPKVTEAHLESRREQILDAAFACFAQRGFHTATMHEICNEAGLSAGAIYRYFSSKDEIIGACVLRCLQVSAPMVEEALNKDDTLDVIGALADIGFDQFREPDAEENLHVHLHWWSEALRSPPLKESLIAIEVEMWMGTLAKVVEKAQSQGEVDPDLDPMAAARVLFAMWQGFVVQKALSPEADVDGFLSVMRALYSGTFWLGEANRKSGSPVGAKREE